MLRIMKRIIGETSNRIKMLYFYLANHVTVYARTQRFVKANGNRLESFSFFSLFESGRLAQAQENEIFYTTLISDQLECALLMFQILCEDKIYNVRKENHVKEPKSSDASILRLCLSR